MSLPKAANRRTNPSRSGYYQLNDSNVALQGYSPVSYFTEGKAEAGNAKFQSSYKGVTYYFTSAAQKVLFDAQPEKYEPAHGGWCSVMMAGSGNRVIADPERFKIVDDKLLVFYRGVAPNGAKVDGGEIWDQRTRSGNPKKQAKNESRMLKKADKAWREIRAGKRRSRIIDA